MKKLFSILLMVGAGTVQATQKAHVHGYSELTLVAEGDQLELEWVAPAKDVVGFEHRADSPKQVQLVEAARDQLLDSEAIYQFIGANCSMADASVDVSSLLPENDHNHREHHDHGHGHEKHHDHERDEGDHSEVIARYRFSCQQLDQLSSLEVKIFGLFSGVQKIKTAWIKNSDQGATELTPQKAVIVFQ